MKLIGFEVSNYAQIDAQFIPAAPGLFLLVGKNNSGKSATLRFLDKEQSTHIARYSAADKQPQLSVIAIFEERDQSPISPLSIGQLIQDQAYARLFLDPAQRTLLGGYIYWKEIEGKQFLAGRPGNPVQFITLNEKGKHQHTASIVGLVHLPTFQSLINTAYIAPHRQIAPSTAMAKTEIILPTGTTLAAYLQTLQGEAREIFLQVEEAFCDLFPDFDRLSLPANGTSVSIHPRLAKSKQDIPLERCGSGLEQALVILAALYEPHRSGLLLIDEPHNFLHPDAERKLATRFSQANKQVIVATHSPVMINSAQPDRLIPIEAPGLNYQRFQQQRSPQAVLASTLSSVGFRNSDALFHDRLIFVEGETDAVILPILLAKSGIANREVIATGFPVLHGVEEMNDPQKIADRLIVYEKLLLSVGRTRQRHLYFLDGDRCNVGPLIERTTILGEHPSIAFTPGRELENLFIDPALITRGLHVQAGISQVPVSATEKSVAEKIDALLHLDKNHPKFSFFFPSARPDGCDPRDAVKGSRLMAELYAYYLLPYEKRLSGKILAEQIAGDDPRLKVFVKPLIKLIEESR